MGARVVGALPLGLGLGLVLSAAVGLPALAGDVVPTCGGLEATIVGTDAADVLRGTGQDDVIVGLGGWDRIDGKGGDDVICGGAGSDALRGGPGNDRLYGESDGRDADRAGVFLVGDVLRGGTGDDLLDLGTDDRRGHQPADVVAYDESATPVVVDLAAEVPTATGEGTDTIVPATETAVLGSPFDDTITGTAREDQVAAGHGNDTVDGGAGDDLLSGDDHLGVDFNLGAAVPLGEEETDDDTVSGGDGRDLLWSDLGHDALHGNAEGDAFVVTSTEPTTVQGGAGPDAVDQVIATSRGNVTDGGPGTDTITFLAPPVEDGAPVATYTIDLRSGSTAVGDVTGTIAGYEEHRLMGRMHWRFFGTSGPDRVWALSGGPLRAQTFDGDDWMIGSEKVDRLDGGPGEDQADGRGGPDTCIAIATGNRTC